MRLTNETEVDEFVQGKPTDKEIQGLTIPELKLIAHYFGASSTHGLNKGELVHMVVAMLHDRDESVPARDEERATEQASAGSANLDDREGSDADGESRHTESQLSELQLKLEIAREETERARLEMQCLKLKSELQENEQVLPIPQTVNGRPEFDVVQNARLLPEFDESNVDQYFRIFERMAKDYSWPKKFWPALLRTNLRGKPLRVYGALEDAQAKDYDMVKTAILRACELVPELYRIKFRNLRKQPNISHVEFSREKRLLWDQWLRSNKEKEVSKLEEAAVLADKYELIRPAGKFSVTHKGKGDLVESTSTKGKAQGGSEAKAVALMSYIDNSPSEMDGGKVDELEGKLKPHLKGYQPFLFQGWISIGGDRKRVTILRDSGALQSLILSSVVRSPVVGGSVTVSSQGGLAKVPLVSIDLQSPLYEGQAMVGMVDELPVVGVDVILVNDLVGGKMCPTPIVSEVPVVLEETEQLERQHPGLFPVCAVTRAMAAQREWSKDQVEAEFDLKPLFQEEQVSETDVYDLSRLFMEKKQVDTRCLSDLQSVDPDLRELYERVESGSELSEEYYLDKGVLFRRWVESTCPTDDAVWSERRQVMLPRVYRKEVLRLGHDSPLSGHLGVRKTLDRIWQHFYWPGIRRDVAQHCRTCHTCQLVGKPNQPVPVAPLKPIPVGEEPFAKVIVDIVGPLPKTARGHEYILTLMDTFSRYPEAIPLRKVRAKVVLHELISFFTKWGLPRELQTDQGSVFLSREVMQSLGALGITKVTSSAYHPQSQGALERYHQTLKTMLRKWCLENDTGWDQALPYLLFAVREVPNESLGLSPFALVFGHEVRGPLKVLKECLLKGHSSAPKDMSKSVTDMKGKLAACWEMARENLMSAQERMKRHYDRNAKIREFNPGDSVLALLPFQGNPLRAKFSGPYEVAKRVGELNYIVATPDRRRSQQLCHINMLKLYREREQNPVGETVTSVCTVSLMHEVDEDTISPTLEMPWKENAGGWPQVVEKLDHLTAAQREDLTALLSKYQEVFRDTPGKTDLILHDVDVGDAKPIKQAQYRVNPQRAAIIRKEIDYMLAHGLITPAQSEWSSPVILVPKADGTQRFCVDFRRVNAVTKRDSYPLPRLEECIDRVGGAHFITKLDLLRGYWQVPMTPRAQSISCFAALGKTYQCKVMPFGMTNAPATFQRLMNKITEDIPSCVTYLDDVVVYSDTWQDHLDRLSLLFDKLVSANLVLNLTKCEFVQAKVHYLGYVIGQGELAPPQAKVEIILRIPVPQTKKEIPPLTDLRKKGAKFQWTESCNTAFVQAKSLLCTAPVLQAPDFSKPFSLYCDTSNIGVGAVLLQAKDTVDHPVSYFSRKLNMAQKKVENIKCNYVLISKRLMHTYYKINFSANYKVKLDISSSNFCLSSA
ncbi:uncharacterized protein LOC143020190 [Oratosquilla oratoria]|uniref:uncharacterized protein LOC143020190 n=1 Tax=Oratosquilla oratoria TaxID=337810 RepID=UPI003F774BA1